MEDVSSQDELPDSISIAADDILCYPWRWGQQLTICPEIIATSEAILWSSSDRIVIVVELTAP